MTGEAGVDSELVDTHRWNQDETKILARGRFVFGRGLMQLKASHWVDEMGGGGIRINKPFC